MLTSSFNNRIDGKTRPFSLSQSLGRFLEMHPSITFVKQPGSRGAAYAHGRIPIPDVPCAAFAVVPRWNNF